MRKVYLVMSVGGGNHHKVLAAFESEHLAEVYLHHVSHDSRYLKYRVLEFAIMDGTPEMNKIVLEGEIS